MGALGKGIKPKNPMLTVAAIAHKEKAPELQPEA